MIPTVGDVIGLSVVQAGRPTVINEQGLDGPVRWVHVSDVADLTDLLQGGELVLTTGRELLRSPRDYLHGLARARAAGVVVELTDQALPEEAARVAHEEGLPLVVLQRVIRFVEVTEEVHRMIVANQYEQVDFARRAHEVFTELTMTRASIDDIVQAAAGLLGEPIVLEDLGHRALSIGDAGKSVAPLLNDWGRRSRMHAAGRREKELEGGWIVTPVGPMNEVWARLIAPTPPADLDRTSMVLERAAQALAMHRMAEKGRADVEHRAQAGLIDDVLRGRATNGQDVFARALALGLDDSGEYVPATVRADYGVVDNDQMIERLNTRLRDLVTHAVRGSGHTGLFSIRARGEVGMIIALRTPRDGDRHALLDALGQRIARDVKHDGHLADPVLGVAEPVKDLVVCIKSIDRSAHVADVAHSTPGLRAPYFRASDLRLRGLIASLRDDRRLQSFAESELQALMLDDIEKGDSGIDLLRAFLETGANKSVLAKRLHMSRPALYARLNELERTLGVSLLDSESRTSLHVAMLILDASSTGQSPRRR
ncbi:PucR family transcriptional regulator [Gordonia sp. OPL2]|uniref:PucR family transcriptional regulator n=1 Tax=Gordonia sp. OPL2 TaxID=2486274 RepID=UPI001654CD0F|nr:PucR family transcriptional regulator [Gordonia sp. OPL2]ROZ99420.1 PucR family transcriptional regulator [Gordonia sp. OPL2]